MQCSCVVAYDSKCGPCTSFKRALRFLDPNRRIAFVPLSEAVLNGSLRQVPPSRRLSSFHAILPDGAVKSGASALPDLLALLPLGPYLCNYVRSAPGGMRALSWAYAILSRLHDSGSCLGQAATAGAGGPGSGATL
ncbi:MAG: DUF393 domain-containing protein [Thaumarchaeota archaeon]|nr:DUF393 domain-containing protein [Nitrososphaerota archaeon]